MTESAPDPARRSPRTDAAPLAFTRGEFLRGAVRAWATTSALLVAAWAVVTGGAGVVSIFVVVPASLVALVAGAPGAYALGRAMRRVPHVAAHVALFAAYGALVGGAMTLLCLQAVEGFSSPPDISPLYLVNVPVSAAGVAAAWFFTARAALRKDSGMTTESQTVEDADARAEDALDERFRVIDPRQRPRA